MNILVMTMVYNESFFLEKWVDYYSKQFGYKNLLILNHGSDDDSLDGLNSEVGKVFLPREHGMNEVRRARSVTRMLQSFLQYYDAVIYCDSDEIIVADPEKYSGLREYLELNVDECIAPLGFNLIQKVSCEPELNGSKNILKQRRYCSFSAYMCKPIINRSPISFGQGFHSATCTPSIKNDLFLFHLKDVDLAVRLDRQKTLRKIQWDRARHPDGKGAKRWLWNDDEVRKVFSRFDRLNCEIALERSVAENLASRAKKSVIANPSALGPVSKKQNFYQVDSAVQKEFDRNIFTLPDCFSSVF
eukprot:TRINITY_DN11825_c1_g1_i1.p2 TRINITY_DN11825_c1_g1~~TRINITY_DN11825_c1_g1_i1.p2  ORF type:complete len:302 (+),score=2.05 TRINITY_DN11825_c1_g1_i1:1781-2686(+)